MCEWNEAQADDRVELRNWQMPINVCMHTPTFVRMLAASFQRGPLGLLLEGADNNVLLHPHRR